MYTNDPKNPVVNLKVTADISVALAIQPTLMQFGTIRRGTQSKEKEISLVGSDADNTQITSVTCANKYVKAEIAEGGAAGKKIKVHILPGMETGRFNEKVTVLTDHKPNNRFQFYVFGEIIGDIQVLPPTLSFGMFLRGGTYDKVIRITAAPGVMFKILDVKTPIPELVPKIETLKEGSSYLLHVRLEESFDQPVLNGEILLTTDKEDDKQIKIAVYGKSFGNRSAN